MAPITFAPVSEVDFQAFTDAFNLAYSDYFVPISMTVSTFRSLISRDDLDLSASVAALDDETIVGMGLLGIRECTGWIGGMGVIPTRRRQGIGRQMMHYLLEQAREHHLERVDLEVIEANRGAYALYRALGFQDYRFLVSVEYANVTTPALSAVKYQVEERPASLLLPYYTTFHDKPNCWQRSYPSLKALAPHVESWAALDHGEVVGYAMGWANANIISLIDFATRPGIDRAGAAQAILAYLHRHYPGTHATMYNIAECDAVLSAFESLGYTVKLRQIEMRYILPNDDSQ